MSKLVSKSAGGDHSVYHLTTDCPSIKGECRTISEQEIQWHGLNLCKWCDPDLPDPCSHSELDMSYQNALKNAANNVD